MDAPRRRTPRQSRSREKVGRILDAARRLLEQEGPEALNTNRIAKEAGVGIGSLYEYFPNKEAIALHLIERNAKEESEAVLAHFPASMDIPLDDAIEAVVKVTFSLYRNHYALYRSLWSMTSVIRTVGHRPGEKAIVGSIKAVLGERTDEVRISDIELTSYMVFQIVEALTTRMLEQDRWDEDTSVAEITKVVRRYLGRPDP